MPSPGRSASRQAVLYARVSTASQAEKGYSLAQQVEALRAYAEAEGMEVVAEIVDSGHSGASLARPGLDRLRDLAAAGEVSVALSQDRDRFAREPALLYLLRRELAEHGTELRSLNDRGDDSPEGELTDGILDQLARYERAKTAERTRRGRLRKAREGKIIRATKPPFGFRFDETGDGLMIFPPEMIIVERIFGMAAEGLGVRAMQARLHMEGVTTPTGKPLWSYMVLRRLTASEIYKAHTHEEIAALVAAEVAAGLDPGGSYGVWWCNRRRVTARTVSVPDGSGGREYRRRQASTPRPEDEWIAVPVPAYLPRDLFDRARAMIEASKGTRPNRSTREWELRGMMRCHCGWSMRTHSALRRNGTVGYFYYDCNRHHSYGRDACPQRLIRAAEAEEAVWGFVSGLLKDPGRIRLGMEALIEREREHLRGDPAPHIRLWAEKIEECARSRRAFQRQQAAGLMSMEELGEALAELDNDRKTAEAELAALRGAQERVEALRNEGEALLEGLADQVPEALDALTGEERARLYRMLGLEVTVTPEGGYWVSGTFCSHEPCRRRG